MIENASLHLAFRHFGTRETIGCSRVDKSRVQKVKLRHSSANSTRSGETPLTRVETRVRRELNIYVHHALTLDTFQPGNVICYTAPRKKQTGKPFMYA